MLTAEHQELAAILGRMFPDRTDARECLESGTAAPASVRRKLFGVGIPALALPAAWGGGDGGVVEQVVVAESLGRSVVPFPLLGVSLAAPVLRAGASEGEEFGQELSAGSSLVGVCLSAERGLPASIRAERRGGDFILSGSVPDALDAACLDVLLIPADDSWWAVRSDDHSVRIDLIRTLDTTRTMAAIALNETPARPVGRLDAAGVVALAWLLLGAEATGAAQAALDLAARYALDRRQFGQPIGRFQAIKHKLADCMVQVEAARSAVLSAAFAAAGGMPPTRLARMAKAVATGAASQVVGEAIQIHGAIGNTWEHDLHLLLRRAKHCQLTLGAPDLHREALAEELLSVPGTNGGPSLATRSPEGALSLDRQSSALIREFRSWLDEHADSDLNARLRHRDMPSRIKAQRAWQSELAEGGWAGIHWPKEFGGRDASLSAQVLYHGELAARRLAPLIGNRGLSLVGPTLIAHGSPWQQAVFVEATRRADILWASGFSEPEAGSDLASLRTKAIQDGDELVITGSKIWITSAHYADYLFTLVRTGPLRPKHEGITCVLVPLDAPGLSIRPIKRMTGVPDFNQVFFDEVRVPVTHVVGDIDAGWRVARTTLTHEHMTNFLGSQMRLSSVVDHLISRLREREASGLCVDHGLRRRVVDAWANTLILRQHGLRNLSRVQAGAGPGPEGSILKLFGQEEEKRLLELAMDIGGASGLRSDRWARGFLSTRASTIGGGTSEIHRNKIAERVLGMPRDIWAEKEPTEI